MTSHCLIVDLDNSHTQALSALTRKAGFDTTVLSDISMVEQWLQSHEPSLAIFDLNLINDRLELFDLPNFDHCEILIMAQEDNPERVHKAIKRGAGYFFCKPYSEDFLTGLVEDCWAEVSASKQSTPDSAPNALDQFGMLRGSSKPMLKLYRNLRKIAASTASVLVIGESGTGKELVAQTLHQQSDRFDQPFVAVNCGAVSASLIESQLFGHEKGSFSGASSQHKGYFECADGGTLFLDEITEMPIDLQVKLLRVLETGTLRRLGSEQDIAVDVRIVAATNRQPEEAINDEKLREDLYYRVAQVPIWLPPLRERGTDRVGLAQHFLNLLNERDEKSQFFTEEALAKIDQLPWYGNVRALQSAVERAALLSEGSIAADAIIEDSVSEPKVEGDFLRVSVDDTLEESERKLIFAALEANEGNKKSTAENLGISLKTLYNRLNEYEQGGDAANG